eukprot:TRINITY_DN7130_c0_g2_i7.p1 TRINITY_DN7130_c0_g2~~TRINITY_DN7130_c0_g2_i7.p1  ORF type:complete len:140 (+),score=19.61 TRINITY_DN7130_c0_g2_i7:65-484(+)
MCIRDSNDYNQMVIGRALTKLKFDVVKAFNGADALEILKNPQAHNVFPCSESRCSYFSIIITDLHMPIMNGLDLIRKARTLPGITGKIPMMMLSASDEKEQVEEGLKAGMNHFLCKPIKEAELLERIKDYHLTRSSSSC